MFNFSNLLNVLDGVLYRSGLITIITTNHPELLDSAIMRQGRMDMVFQINYPKKKDIMKMFCVMFEKKYVTDDEMATEFARFYNYIQGKKIPMSAIVNFLFRHRDKYEDHISTFLDTDSFLKEVTFTDTKLYG
jgi:ATP-dependent 26S proteasome regulatory subunit